MADEKDRGREKEMRVPFHKLFSFADSWDAVLMATGAVGAVGCGMAIPLIIFIIGELINAFERSDLESIVPVVSKVCLKFIYLAAGSAVASFLQVACWMVSGERQAARIRGLYLKAILRQEIAFFDNETKTGEVIGRMSGDTILIQDAIGEKVGKFIQLCSTFFGSFVIAFAKGWLLSLVMLSSILLIVIAGAALSSVIFRSSNRVRQAYAAAGTVVEHTIESIRTVVSFNGENQAIDSYKKLVKDSYHASVHQDVAAGTSIGCVAMIIFCSYGLAIWYGANLIIEKGYNGGSVFYVIITITAGGISLRNASPCLTAFASGQAAAYKMLETINRKPDIDVYDTNGIVLEDIKGEVELRDVRFFYPARPDQLIFDGFSLYVPRGTTMALVGESGSGKSTVVSLVERFYDPQGGEVLIDDINLKKLKLRWIRDQIGLVSQEPILFTTTIRENIAYGKAGATTEEIRRAVELANAAKFIDNMPNGLDTMVGEHGTQLSGGQKKRIAIARVIMKNPKILLLDEATSALDAESERVVQDALETIMTNRTTIVIAHRLTTVKNADTISVISRGKLLEQGSHSELIKNPTGAYSQLIRLQEVNEHAKEAPPSVGSSNSLFTPASLKHLTRSGSSNLSIRRSISRGSSFEQSNRNYSMASSVFPHSIQDYSDPMEYNCDEEEKNNTTRRKPNVKRLAYLNKPELPVLVLGSIFAAIHGVVFPVFGVLISNALKLFFEPPHQLLKGSKFWALMYCLLGFVTILVVPAQYYMFGVAGGKLIERIRFLSFERVVHQEIGWFDKPSNTSGQICARLSADASIVRRLVGDTLAVIVQNTSTILAGLLIAFVANWRLTLIILFLLPLFRLQEYAQMRSLHGFGADAKVMYEEASQVASDAVGSIRTVASFCAEQSVMDVYQAKCRGPLRHGERQGIISGLGYGFSFLVLYSTFALCFYVGARFIHDGMANFHQLFRVYFALTWAAQGISYSSTIVADLSKAKDSASSIFAILDRNSKIDSSSNEGDVLDDVKGDIKFQHVSFSYPSRPHLNIFTDFCLHIPSGKTVALVGESGTGKSTVIALLQRFYDPAKGSISLDGIDIHKFRISWLRQQMGLVSQEPVLFSGTIRANIAYGKQGVVPEEEILAAAEAAGAHRFISSLPQGYETSVGERGVQLSGGQKQRIAIARAVLKDPKILLVDEATSALDAESERVVQDALDRAMVGRTAVVVAHRLSTVRGADLIAVVNNGIVAEQGAHEALIRVANGLYASLVALQTSSMRIR